MKPRVPYVWDYEGEGTEALDGLLDGKGFVAQELRHVRRDRDRLIDDLVSVIIHLEKWKRTRDPADALETIRICRERNCPRPRAILDWLEEALQDYHQAEGSRKLERILGFGGRGKTNSYKKLAIERRDAEIEMDMHYLLAMGMTVMESATLAWARLDQNGARDLPDPDSFARTYRKRRGNQIEHLRKEQLRQWNATHKRKYLRQFPAEHIPPRIRLWLQD
jgi:hypothetical protein